jgi:hypothetical protein
VSPPNLTPSNLAFTNFNENIPLRNLPIVTDTVPGASAIQEYIDRAEWAQQAGNPAADAPFITRPIIIQFARGDQTVPNPTASAILRACGCANRATLFRNDLAFAANPATPKNPHTFLTNIGVPSVATIAVEAQAQMATFLASDGTGTVDPDGPGPIFETPTSMVPEDLAYIPWLGPPGNRPADRRLLRPRRGRTLERADALRQRGHERAREGRLSGARGRSRSTGRARAPPPQDRLCYPREGSLDEVGSSPPPGCRSAVAAHALWRRE